MNKYKFIKELLESNSITTTQKEMVLRLSAEALDKEKVKALSEIEIKKFKSNNNKKIQLLPRPMETYELLNKFSTGDGGIKNLTHAFNYGYIEYDQLMKQCRKEFDEGKDKYKNVPIPLLTRIEQFAFSKEPKWYTRRGKDRVYYNLGWSEPSFIEWYKKNKTHPSENAKYAKEMIIPFKETIQIRADLQNLNSILEANRDIVFGTPSFIEMEIDSSIKTAQFFTDVDSLSNALYHIFIAIKNNAERNFCDKMKIEFEILKDKNIKILKIIHLDSKPSKSIKEYNFLGGDLNATKKSLYGLCNYEIEAEFPEGFYRKTILSDKTNFIEEEEIKNENVLGFTHKLKFY